jgi:hypothetical protein
MKKLLVLLILVMSATLLFLGSCKNPVGTVLPDPAKGDLDESSPTMSGGAAGADVILSEIDEDTGVGARYIFYADGTFKYEVYALEETPSLGTLLNDPSINSDGDDDIDSEEQKDVIAAYDLNEDGEIAEAAILIGVDDDADDDDLGGDVTDIAAASHGGTWSYDADESQITFTITEYYGHLIETDVDQFDIAWDWHTINWDYEDGVLGSGGNPPWDGALKEYTFTALYNPVPSFQVDDDLNPELFKIAKAGSTVYTYYEKQTFAGDPVGEDEDSTLEYTAIVTIDEDAQEITVSVEEVSISGVGLGPNDYFTTRRYRSVSQPAFSSAWTIGGSIFASDNSSAVYIDGIVYGYDIKDTDEPVTGLDTYELNDVVAMSRYEVDTDADSSVMKALTGNPVSYPELRADDLGGDDEILDVTNSLVDTNRDGEFVVQMLDRPEGGLFLDTVVAEDTVNGASALHTELQLGQ